MCNHSNMSTAVAETHEKIQTSVRVVRTVYVSLYMMGGRTNGRGVRTKVGAAR